ncbi:MAG TPA: protein kinase [Kofleriaceae bacterium]|nr:protein kinase [Kofleriaceae bacterium]
MSRAAAEVGSTANSYQILAKLATGGMAEIFLARGESVAGVERYCVLKRILRDRASDVHFVRMFLDEARLAAQLQHPNIAQVYDIGKLGDSYFFTMEYVHGETVRSLLQRALGLKRKLPIGCVLTIAAGTAAGLHHAHERLSFDGRPLGIVHRDVSPSNLMVSYEGGVKVVDFGVAKAADRGHETKSGTVKGKISYLSPEQCKGKRVDRRSDLFSLGICLWEMLTTDRLYRRSSDFENMHAIVNEATPPPSSRRGDVPPEVDELVLRLLRKTADERLQTAEQVVEAIEEVAARTGSVLSTSALGKLMRELFGQRPEPWLEIENQPEVEAITVTGEPIPPELAAAPAEKVNQQLASVVDLSPRVVTESLDLDSAGALAALPFDIPTTLGKRVPHGFPLAAPPPSGADIPVPADDLPAEPSPPVRPSGDLPPALPPPPRATGRSYATGLPGGPSGDIAAVPPSSPPRPAQTPPAGLPSTAALPSTDLGALAARIAGRQLPLVAPAEPTGSSSLPQAPAASSSAPQLPAASSAHVPRTTASASSATAADSQGSLRGSASYHPPPERHGWPFYAVIGGAALVGSIVVMFAMRSDWAATDAASAPAPAVRSADSPASPSPTGSISVVPIEPSTDSPASAATNPAPTKPISDERSSEAADGAAATSRPPRTPKATAPRTAPPAAATAPPATSAAALSKRDRDDALGRSYAAELYDKVLEQCGAGPVNADHAPLCFLAACHLGNAAKASKLLAAVPGNRRDQLITNCKQLGVDLKKAETVDCEADPMACQH